MPHNIAYDKAHPIILQRQDFEKIPRQLRSRTVQMFENQTHPALLRTGGHRGKLIGNQGLLHLAGFDSVTNEDLQQFRQLNSVTPGHPENFMTPGVEVTTGPLGMGIAMAVGLAISGMYYLRCLHPPGGATALLAVIGGEQIHSMGFGFVIYPILINVVLLLLVAISFNAFFKWRIYLRKFGSFIY